MSVGGRAAAEAIGPWPGHGRKARAVALAGGTVAGSASARHAESVWCDAREDVMRSARGMGERAGSSAPLGMVAALASHLGVCGRCWRTGPYDSRTPAQWLMWAAARRPGLAAVLEPVLAELAGSRLDRSLSSLR